MNLSPFFISRTRQNYTKPLTVSAYTLKMKVINILDTFRNFIYVNTYLQINFFMKTRLHNIFKNVNTMGLTKVILESPYKIL